MEKELISKWDKNKGAFRFYLKTTPQSQYAESYTDFIKCVISQVLEKNFNVERLSVRELDHMRDDLYLIPDYACNRYLAIALNYGTCSECDTLERIRGGCHLPDEITLNGYMTMALHIIQAARIISLAF